MADYAISGARLQPIYERLNSAPRYHPIEAETFADWSMEAGDIVTITRDGQSYESPVQTSVVKWRKGQQVSVSSGGNQQRDAVSKMSQNKYSRASGGAGLRNSRHLGDSITASYNELAAGLVVTASGIYQYAINQYTGLSSGLTQTASAITAFVNSRYDEMSAGLEITSSSISQYVEDRYSNMRAGLDITSSSLHAYVRSRYEDMQAGLALTSSSAALYAGSTENAAQIVARINAAGQSEIELLASHIYMGAGGQPVSVVVNGKISASYITADLIAGKIADIEDVSVKKIHSERGSAIFHTISAKNYLNVSDVDCSYLPNGVRTLQIVQSGDNYKLQKTTYAHPDEWTDVGTFSRATSLTGVWSGGEYTVTASPQDASITAKVTLPKSTQTSYAFIDIAFYNESTDSTPEESTRYTVSADDDYAYIKWGSTIVARASHTAYDNGWSDAFGKLDLPKTRSTAHSYIDIKTPSETVGATEADNTRYTVSADDDYAYIKWGSTTVARVANSAYDSGWSDAYGKVSLPKTQNTSNAFIDIGTPSSVVGTSSPDNTRYTLTSDSSYAYINWGSTVVARKSISPSITVNDLQIRGGTWSKTGTNVGSVSKANLDAPCYISFKVNGNIYYITVNT